MDIIPIKSQGQGGEIGDFLEADGDGQFQRIEQTDVLQPGIYWRVKDSCEDERFMVGDLHLLLEVCLFEDTPQSVNLLEHPRDGGKSSLNVIIANFLADFEPVTEEVAQAQRASEQQAIMNEVARVQEEMNQAQINPLALPEVQEAANSAVESFEADEQARIQAEVKDRERREADLRRIHRRAARRSEAKGNPLAVRRATISDSVEVMISEGITSDGVRELSLEAGRRIAIATAASKVLSRKADQISTILKGVTPYYAEKGRVALAKASKAITMVKNLEKGITSLKLYTGDSVTVVPVRDGQEAPRSEPLTLMQSKLYMDQELAVWADVQDSFDHSSQEEFFKHLRSDDRLLNQVLPAPRCVVSMAVTARRIDYDSRMHWYDRLMKELKNKVVFLLVRNGDKVYAVYSEEPSHEAAARLFPTQSELEGHFRGVDGSRIGLNDIRFAESREEFENTALTYKRFLILLAGLDHREQLFGDFYPREQAMSFMSLEFQHRYFRFVADQDAAMITDGSSAPRGSAHEWMDWCQSQVRSGSRVILSSSATHIHLLTGERQKGHRLEASEIGKTHIVTASKGHHCIDLTFSTKHGFGDNTQSKVWLDGPLMAESSSLWHLCMDRVRLVDVQHYLYRRSARPSNLAILRLLRRAEEICRQEEQEQEALRAHLRKTAIEHKVRTENDVDEAIDNAICLWRAAHKGASAPNLEDRRSVNELLTLIYPAENFKSQAINRAQEFADCSSLTPLRLVMDGKGKLALYCAEDPEEVASIKGAVHWGWVRRHVIQQSKSKFTSNSSSLAWLNSKAPITAEETLHEWPELNDHMNDDAEPVRLAAVKTFIEELELTAASFADLQGDHEMPKWLENTVADKLSRKKLYPNGYLQEPYLMLPVAIVQKTPTAKPQFIYAMADAAPYMRAHAPEGPRSVFKTIYTTSTAGKERWRERNLRWRLVACDSRCAPGFTYDYVGQTPKWSTINGRKRGDGQHRDFKLSMNRAFDALMGRYGRLKKKFYENLQEEIQNKLRWPDFGEKPQSRKEKVRELLKSRYEFRKPTGILLSSLVWNDRLGRSTANSVFRKGPQ